MQHDIIPPARFAKVLIEGIKDFLSMIGIHHTGLPEEIIYLVAVLVIAIVSGRLVQWLIMLMVRRVLDVHFKPLSDQLAKEHVLSRCGRVIPPVVLLSLLPFVFDIDQRTPHIILIVALIYLIVMTVAAINSVLAFSWSQYNARRNQKNLPLRGILDITRGAIWVVAVIIIISLIVGKSPLALLTGLGAFAAVLMLLFKDYILGLVAGVQLAQNDMLRVGDWISVPGTEANGIVQDVSLVVVKVRNWNNTVSMLPAYSLVTKQFINWRCMKETGSRHIQMSVPIDIATVRPLSDAELQAIAAQVPLLKNFIDVKMKQRADGLIENVNNPEAGANGTIDTNLGLLRAYFNLYARQHPYVYKDRPIMVRLLQPTPTGYPLQLFCYLTTADWTAYEAIMADIFEHITAIAPTFGLSIYQEPSTRSIYGLAPADAKGQPYYGNTPINIANGPSPDQPQPV